MDEAVEPAELVEGDGVDERTATAAAVAVGKGLGGELRGGGGARGGAGGAGGAEVEA